MARYWAKALGIDDKDKNGVRTKAHVHQMLTRYRARKDIETATGAGIIWFLKTMDGKVKEVDMTIQDQEDENYWAHIG